jgi:hypothetical protein
VVGISKHERNLHGGLWGGLVEEVHGAPPSRDVMLPFCTPVFVHPRAQFEGAKDKDWA